MEMLKNSEAPKPQGQYVPASRWSDLIFTAGMTPRVDGDLIAEGPITESMPTDYLQAAAEAAAKNALSAACSLLEDDEVIGSVLKATVFVAAVEDFKIHSAIADLTTAEIVRQLPHTQRWARSAIGVTSLPNGALLEIELTVSVERRFHSATTSIPRGAHDA